jgi:transcription antitermination factor NusG
MITKHSNYGGNFGGDFIKLNAINNNSKKKLEQPEMFKGYILLSLVDNMQAIEILKSVSAKVIKKYTQERLFTKEDRGDFHWFLLRCRGGTENKVIEHIEKHPLHSENFKNEFIQLVEYEKRNVNKIKGINMFAGYFLVEMRDTQEARLILRGCRTSIIKQYTEANVQELISKILEEEKLTTNKDFQVKEEVIVNTSIFSGEGVIISINEEKQRAMVQFYYFGAYNTISVPFTDLEKKRKTKEVKYKPKPKY